MGLSKEELIKIYSFLLENEDIIIEDKGLFNKNILVEIDSIIKGKRANGFKLTKEQENLIINLFLGSESVFNEYTPSFVLENFECIKVALQRDINSANYIINIDKLDVITIYSDVICSRTI